MGQEGAIPEPLSDEEHDVLRGFAGAQVVLPQARQPAAGRAHRLPTGEHFPVTPPSDSPQERISIRHSVAASLHPERKLS